MKKLLASAAVVALLASPAIAQSTIDPATPDSIPTEPTTPQAENPMNDFMPQTEPLPAELPPEPDMAEEVPAPTPDAEPTMQAEVEPEEDYLAETEDDATFAETEDNFSVAEAEAEAETTMTADVVAPDVALEASVSESDLPEEYSTDDLNARMLAAVNTIGTEISELDAQADVWVTADGSAVDPTYAPEGQGDLEVMSEEAPATDSMDYMNTETETLNDDSWNSEEPVDMEDPSATEY